jgi:hypothetical protein
VIFAALAALESAGFGACDCMRFWSKPQIQASVTTSDSNLFLTSIEFLLTLLQLNPSPY